MLFTKQEIDELLGLASNPLSTKITHNAKGPGYLDPWLLLEHRKDIWQHTTSFSSETKKQIIVSEPLEGRRKVSLFELSFFSTLFEYFHVYFWPNNGQPFREVRPLSDPADFWNNKINQPFVATESIRDSLVSEGLSLDNIIIIDFDIYREITAKALQCFPDRFKGATLKQIRRKTQSHLDLSGVDLTQVEELATCLNPQSIKSIRLRPTDSITLNLILNLFAHLESLEIRYAHAPWLLEHLTELEHLNLIFSRFMPNKTFTLPAFTRLNSLTISVHQGTVFEQFRVEQGASIKSLELRGLRDTRLKLKSLNDLEIFKLRKSSYDFSEKRKGRLDFISDELIDNPILLPLHLKELILDQLSISQANLELDNYIASNPSLSTLVLHLASHKDGTIYLTTSPKGLSLFERWWSRLRENVNRLAGLEVLSIRLESSVRSYYLINLIGARNLKCLANATQWTSLIEPRHVVPCRSYPHYKEESLESLGDELWTIDGCQYDDIDPLVRSNRELFHLKSSTANACINRDWKTKQVRSLCFSRLQFETSLSEYTFNIIGSKLRFITLRDLGVNASSSLILNFSDCSKLEVLKLSSLHELNLTLILNQNPFLSFLDIDVPKSVVQISAGPKNIRHLRHLRIGALNAMMLQEIISYDVGQACMTYFFDGSINNKFTTATSSRKNLTIPQKYYRAFLVLSLSALVGSSVWLMYNVLTYIFQKDHQLPPPSPLPPSTTPLLTTTTPAMSSTTDSNTHAGIPIYKGFTAYHIFLIVAGVSLPLLIGILSLVHYLRARSRSALAHEEFIAFTDEGCSVDTNTLLSEPSTNAHYPLMFNCYSQDNQRPDHVLIRVQDRVTYNKKRISFSTSSQEMKPFFPAKKIIEDQVFALNDLMDSVSQKNDRNLIYLEGVLNAGTYCPLPGFYPVEKETDFLTLYSEQADLIDCFYHPIVQQVYIKWASVVKGPQNIKLFYEVKKNPAYLDNISNENQRLYQQRPQLLLSQFLIDHIHDALKNHEPLAFLFDNNQCLEEKITSLTRYFRGFSIATLTNKPSCQLEAILTIIKEKKGVCRHRSQGFMLLAHFLGCPVVVASNSRHMFCALPYQNEEGSWQYKRLDLSLLSGALWEQSDNIFRVAEREGRNDRQFALESICIDPQEGSGHLAYMNYKAYFEDRLSLKELDSLEPILNTKHNSAPLVILNDVHPFALNQAVIRALKALGVDTLTQHFFIDSPQAFLMYLKPYKIEQGQIVEEQNGPLRRLITSSAKTAVLVINWNTFTSAEMASYQSIMDREPMLCVGDEAFYLPKRMLILGLMQNKKNAGAAFLSRTQPFVLSPSFAQQLRSGKLNSCYSSEEVIKTHLFGQPAWRESVFGAIDFSPSGILLGEGSLTQALRADCSLEFTQPPQDGAFELFVHHINEEGKYLSFAEGQMREIPASVSISTTARDMGYLQEILDQSKVLVHRDDCTEILKEKRSIYLGLDNFHELYKILIIDNLGEAHSLKGGLLASYREEKDVFYVVGDIPKSSWDALLEHIQNTYPDKRFEFVLSPGSNIEAYHESVPAPLPKHLNLERIAKSTKRIFLSSDPDYLSTVLAAALSDPWVVYTHEGTTFNDLIAVVYKQEGVANRFVYKRQAVLEALISGQSVILNGPLSLTLYLQLMSLCSQQPHIFTNGERIEPSGSLYLVLPEEKMELPFIQGQCVISMETYHQALSSLPQYDTHRLNQIKNFYDGALKLPHSGRGRPSMPKMSYAHLSGLLAALNEDGVIHPHNPIKGLFLYDYPRRSEEQAYLNVLGKYYFKPHDTSPLRAHKLIRLLEIYDLRTVNALNQHLWVVLNCFNGADLQDILGCELSEVVYDSGMPTLSQQAMKHLLALCQEQSLSTEEDTINLEQAGFNKSLEQLAHFLNDPHKKVLMLKGLPGVGKTYAIRRLIGQYYEGESSLREWFSDRGELLYKVWLGDEANMLPPGTLDALIKGLCSGQEKIVHQGQLYIFDPRYKDRYKIILTGNPESFPGRYYHASIQDYAETLYFEKPSDAFLERHAQSLLPQILHFAIPILIFAYHRISYYNPYLATSIRDIESLVKRFAYLYRLLDKPDTPEVKQALLRACVSEFSCSIKEEAKRGAFISDLEDKTEQSYRLPRLEQSPLIRLTDKVSVPREKAYIIDTLLMNLGTRLDDLIHRALSPMHEDKGKGKKKKSSPGFFQAPVAGEHKKYLILQGDPGLGKSTLLRALLTYYLAQLKLRRGDGLSENRVINEELSKSIYLASGGSSDATAILKKALEEEAFVILDESNIDPDLEPLLLQYLSGVDEDKKPIHKPGFMVLASENNTAQEGRIERSPAAQNRSQLFYFPSYSYMEYLSFARDAQIKHPEEFVKAFLDLSKEDKSLGARHFFKWLEAEKERKLMENQPLLILSESSEDEETPLILKR